MTSPPTASTDGAATPAGGAGPMPGWSTTANAVIGAGFALLIALALGVAVVGERRARDARAITASVAAERDLQGLLSELRNAENGHDRYLLTHQSGYAAQYDAALGDAADTMARIAERDPAVADRLRPFLDRQLASLRRTHEAAQAGDFAGALEIVGTGDGAQRAREMLGALDEQMAAAEMRREMSSARWTKRGRRMNLLLALTAALALGLSALVARTVLAHVKRVRAYAAALAAEADRREKSEAALRQAHRLEAVGQLTGGLAHDFNNLLTIVIGNLDAIEQRLGRLPVDVEAVRAAAERAMGGARRAADVTRRLLAFARRQTLAPQPTDVNRATLGVCDMLGRTIGDAIAIETALADDLWAAHIDPGQLENALVNLVVNARDAMPDGGRIMIETANVHLDAAYARQFEEVAPGDYVLVSVADTGAGMDAQTLAHMFEPYFTTKKDGRGTGLGLAMVHGFVRQSGGHIRIYSEPGRGTVAKLYLPRHQGVVASAPTAPPALARDPRARPGERILIVEDDEEVMAFASAALRDLGYEVVLAGDADAATAIAAGPGRIDLLFTDIMLADGMNGHDLAATLIERRPALPVLYTTGYAHRRDLGKGAERLDKPYMQHDLARKVRDILDRADARSL